MKYILLFFLAITPIFTKGQTMSNNLLLGNFICLNEPNAQEYYRIYSNDYRKFSTTTKVGVVATITGPIIFFAGKSLIQDYGNNQDLGKLKTGAVLYGAGLFITSAGLGMLVGGGIHDYRTARQREAAAKARRLRMQQRRNVGYLVPYTNGYNEVGIAFHF